MLVVSYGVGINSTAMLVGMPPKSACFFCPATKKPQVLWLAKNRPDLFARAVAMEDNAEGLQVVKGLGRHWSWKDLVSNPDKDYPDPPEMACECLDGSSED